MGFKVKTGGSSPAASILLIAGGLAAILAVVAAMLYFLQTRVPEPDAKTLCPHGGANGHVVLLVDKSDPMSFTQRKDFEVLFRRIVEDRVQPGQMLSIYALADDFRATAEPIIQICHPGDVRNVNSWRQNAEMLRDDYEKNYIQPMRAIFPQLITERAGKASPILEMIQLVGITGFKRTPTQGEKILIVVSDFIQNTSPGLNMYADGIPAYDQFIKTDYGRGVSADLEGVQAEFHVLLNTPRLQDEKLLNFWVDHVRRNGGRFKFWDPVKGH